MGTYLDIKITEPVTYELEIIETLFSHVVGIEGILVEIIFTRRLRKISSENIEDDLIICLQHKEINN